MDFTASPRLDLYPSPVVIRVIVWLMVIGAAGSVGWMLPRIHNINLILVGLGALLGLGAGVLLLVTPSIGLVVLVFASQLVPLEVGTGTQTTLNPAVLLIALLSGVWIFSMLVKRRIDRKIRSRAMFPLISLIIVAILSFFIGQIRWFPMSGAPILAQLGGLAIFILSALAFLVMAHLIQNMRWLAGLTMLFLGCVALYLLFANLISVVMPSFNTVLSRLKPSYWDGASGSLVWVWAVSFAFSQILVNRKLAPHWKGLCILLLAAIFFVRLFITGDWTSGWLPSATAMAVILVLGLPRLGPLLLGIAGLAGTLNFALVRSQLLSTDNLYSLGTRLAAWKILFNLALVNPIFGFGPANYHWYTSLTNILGYYVTFNSHNNYVDLILQTGLVGLACYLWFLVEIGRVGWNLKDRVEEGFPKAYVIACLGGLGGTLVAGMFGDWVIPFTYNVGMAGMRSSYLTWLFFGGLVAIEYWLSVERPTE